MRAQIRVSREHCWIVIYWSLSNDALVFILGHYALVLCGRQRERACCAAQYDIQGERPGWGGPCTIPPIRRHAWGIVHLNTYLAVTGARYYLLSAAHVQSRIS